MENDMSQRHPSNSMNIQRGIIPISPLLMEGTTIPVTYIVSLVHTYLHRCSTYAHENALFIGLLFH